MTYVTLTTFLQDSAFGTGNSGYSIGTVGGNNTLTGVDVVGLIGFQQYAVTGTGNTIDAFVGHGIQHGNTGYSFEHFVATPDNAAWLSHQFVKPSDVAITYPSGGTLEILASYTFELKWRGQYKLPATNQDFYYSIGNTIGGSVQPWKLYAEARIYYSG